MDIDSEDAVVLLLVEEIVNLRNLIFIFDYLYIKLVVQPRKNRRVRRRLTNASYRMSDRLPFQIEHMKVLVEISDRTCIEQLRMDRNTFARLCYLLEHVGGIKNSRNIHITEQVAMFLSVLAHHKKNRVVKFDFKRSGQTISKFFHNVLRAVLRLHPLLCAQSNAVTDSCTDWRWRWFKGCLGALDGTYIPVRVPARLHPRYRNRKSRVSVNVLGVCTQEMNFSYVLTGWEGSAADSRVLRDAVHRPGGLRVPTGNYYLCDGGYTNGPGFLAPYRGVRYHLDEFGEGNRLPRNHRELFNLRHARARNVIERAFGVLKMRWAVLRSKTYFDIRTQNKIILACCLLQNFIRMTMHVDPMENEAANMMNHPTNPEAENPFDYVDVVEPSTEWTEMREDLAMSMFNEWDGRS